MPDPTDSCSDRVQEKKAIFDLELSISRFNYEITIKATELFLQASRQGALLCLALIAAASIWEGSFASGWTKAMLAMLVLSVASSALLHVGMATMHGNLPRRILTEDHDLELKERIDIDDKNATILTKVAFVFQVFSAAIPVLAILFNLAFS
tara:strand:+ start:199 stop:654 length:456 start_codon:yes stop_codon:yes gene_type:complete